MVYERFSGFVEAFELVGDLTPSDACTQINHRYPGVNSQSKIWVKGDEVKVSVVRTPNELLAYTLRSLILNITAALDGQLLLSGQPVQVTFDHPLLRPGEGEGYIPTRSKLLHQISPEHFSVGLTIGQMAEVFPPLGHTLRDFRLATVLSHEDGVPFLWRSLESILWIFADEEVKSAENPKNVQNVANKLGVEPKLFEIVRVAANHQLKFARHATKRYRDRLQWLKKVYKREAPPFFSEPIAIGDDNPVDVFPVSYDEKDWQEIWMATREIIMKFIPKLNPYTMSFLVPFTDWD